MTQTGHADSSHADEHHGDEHHGGYGQYFAVFIALCVLTTMSMLTYTDYWKSHVSPQIGWAFMMAVSCSKALLVILFFMHLKYEQSWKYMLTIPTTIMAIFLVLMLVPDIGRRTDYYSEERLQFAAPPPAPQEQPPKDSTPPD